MDWQVKHAVKRGRIATAEPRRVGTIRQTWCYQQLPTSKSAESTVYLRGVQIELPVFSEGTSISHRNHFDHTFVREMRFRTSSALFLIRAKINQSCERAL